MNQLILSQWTVNVYITALATFEQHVALVCQVIRVRGQFPIEMPPPMFGYIGDIMR